MNDLRLAVLGTGIMGSAMARRFARAGLSTTAWDRSAASALAVVDAGVRAASTAEEAVRGADVVVTMLATADAVASVVLNSGVLDTFERGATWAQMGTIGVEETARVAAQVRERRPDVLFVDAPVSGSKGPAMRGELLILASGPREAERILARPFAAIGRKTVWLGEAGQGSRMKLVLNAYLSILVQGVAEALKLADDLGVDHAKLLETIEGGPLDAPIASAKLHKMEARDYEPEFPLAWALKDVDLALATAGAHPPPLLAALSRQWHAAVARGLGRNDISAARLALPQSASPGDVGPSR